MRAIGTTDGENEGDGLNVRLIGTADGERETGDDDLNGLGLADRPLGRCRTISIGTWERSFLKIAWSFSSVSEARPEILSKV
jgi:hypothetical protein